MAEKILIVDDESRIRKLFSDLLSNEGYAVSTASKGEEAVAIIGKEDFDIVLLDVMLSGIAGIETLKKIKEIKPKTTVIMLTSLGYDEKIVNQSKELGSSGYISKHLPMHEIMESFNFFLDIARENKRKS
jgi:DNA-binding response OmpR family regulator